MSRALTYLLALWLAGPAMASGAWQAFHDRCLLPLENLFPPLVAELDRVSQVGEVYGYRLADGAALYVDLAPEDGLSACQVADPSGMAEAPLRAWIRAAVASERYERVGEDVWHSVLWIEPILEVRLQRGEDGVVLRILETELEA